MSEAEIEESTGKTSEEEGDAESVTVSCGTLTGRLILSRYLCPGIHQECIEYEGQIVTPKMFSVMGDKEKLKDWKNAIRLNGRSIRKVMDAGLLDFAKHDQHCTGRCASRNTGISKYDLSGLPPGMEGYVEPAAGLIDPATGLSLVDATTGLPLVADMANLGKEPAYSILREVTGTNDEEQAKIEVMLSQMQAQAQPKRRKTKKERQKVHVPTALPVPVVFPMTAPVQAITGGILPRPVIDVGPEGIVGIKSMCSDGMMGIKSVKLPGEAEVAIKKEPVDDDYKSSSQGSLGQKGLLGHVTYKPISRNTDHHRDLQEEDVANSQTFWQGIMHVGLLEEIFEDMKQALNHLKTELVKSNAGNPNEAKNMTRIVHELNLMNKIKHKMAQQKNQTEREKESLLSQLEALKRKVAESEAMQRELKRKSDCYDQLMEMSRSKRAMRSPPSAAHTLSERNSPDSSSSKKSPRRSAAAKSVASTGASDEEAVTSGGHGQRIKLKHLPAVTRRSALAADTDDDSSRSSGESRDQEAGSRSGGQPRSRSGSADSESSEKRDSDNSDSSDKVGSVKAGSSQAHTDNHMEDSDS